MSGQAGSARPPRIGVSSCFFHADPDRPIFKGKTLLYVEQSMMWWVQSGGALAYAVPTVADGAPLTVDDVVADLDGLLLHGGSDVCPRTYGEEPLRPEWEGDEVRDRYEMDLVRRFLAAGKPVLGICRGVQLLNVAFGGTLWQDLVDQGATERVHRSQELYDANLHRVDVVPGSALARLTGGAPSVLVNSIHHQAVRDVGEGLIVEARSSDDGVVEALRLDDDEAWALGVQWHPEFFAAVDEPALVDNGPILDSFLDAARHASGAAVRRDVGAAAAPPPGAGS